MCFVSPDDGNDKFDVCFPLWYPAISPEIGRGAADGTAEVVASQRGEVVMTKRSAHSIYEQLGGLETFRRLADAFYTRIENDPFLRPMFPKELSRPRERQA